MVEYRYHRLAANTSGWKGPVEGRLGRSSDYVGTNGFGHEDWNFTKDVWGDGKCHLYVQGQPARADRTKAFNIALGAKSAEGHYVVAFCENVTYVAPKRPPKELCVARARQLHELNKTDSLAGPFRNLPVDALAEALFDDGEIYWICLSPNDLTILETPVLAPNAIIKKSYHRYGLQRLSELEYRELRSLASPDALAASQEEDLFPEGALHARIHLHRERNSSVVRLAKSRFIEKHGTLFCEACKWRPVPPHAPTGLSDRVIEAHHDVPLSSPHHGGETRIDDIRMLCPNCHRIIHAARPWRTVDELRVEIASLALTYDEKPPALRRGAFRSVGRGFTPTLAITDPWSRRSSCLPRARHRPS